MAFSPPQVHQFHCHKVEGDLLWPGGEGGEVGTGAGGKEEGRSYIEQCSPFSSLVGDGRQGQEGEAGGRQGEGRGGRGHMPFVGGLGTACVLKQ